MSALPAVMITGVIAAPVIEPSSAVVVERRLPACLVPPVGRVS